MAGDQDYEPPKETAAEAHSRMARRGGAGALPFLGPLATELLETIFTPAFTRRRDQWMSDVAEALRRHDADLDRLSENEGFVDAAIQAASAAVRTSKQEKRDALRNAVLNSALPDAPDETLRQIFIGMIDSFSGLHLRLLSFLDDPVQCLSDLGVDFEGRAPMTVQVLVDRAYPDLAENIALADRVCAELHAQGLVMLPSLREDVGRIPYNPDLPREEQKGYRYLDELPRKGVVAYSGRPTSMRHWTTETGRQFLAFITEPEAS